MVDPAARKAEQDRYAICYQHHTYGMGHNRKHDCMRMLESVSGKNYLDVGCGRGEMLDYAEGLGYSVQGVEAVPYLTDGSRVIKADAHALPFADKAFDVVAMLDVIEHLLPGDDEAACRELCRVSRGFVLLTASNKPSICPDTGFDLHVNKRPYQEWDGLFRKWFTGTVRWQPIKNTACPPEMHWIVEIA